MTFDQEMNILNFAINHFRVKILNYLADKLTQE